MVSGICPGGTGTSASLELFTRTVSIFADGQLERQFSVDDSSMNEPSNDPWLDQNIGEM